MKTIIIILILLPIYGISQLGAGMSAGLSNKGAIAEMYIVKPLTKNVMLYPVSFKVHSKMSDATKPVIIEPRLGAKLSSWELYGGYGYHFIGNENHKELDPYKGWKLGAGIIKHLGKNLIVSTSISGNVVALQVGIFGIK